ncbi:hypothetical protein [Streptomyces qinzhouensis]|uniref:t-SNARE coiled-coil homology domain-containing protein n=1 Tax=Streptomyces qinzhouensis TaxID=2599401 RepID=A0A5B8IGH9_9ACTN|nr:hypothetical protein [Streptomyces qinzhouensis]QDY77628.1 hypothetical protein FQU76_15065 [Streptomyces qinzhouensis]
MPEDPITQGEIDVLTRRVEAVEDRVESLQVQTGGNFAAVVEGQAALRREVRDGFAGVNARLDGFDTRFEGVEARLGGLGNRFDRLENRFDGLENRFGGLENRFDRLGNRFDGLEQKIDQHQARIVELLTQLVGRDADGR